MIRPDSIEKLISIYKDVYKNPINQGHINSLREICKNNEYDYDQVEQIYKGIRDDLNITLYLNPNYSFSKMCWIRRALKDRVDVSPYLDFSGDCISIIYQGLKEGLQVDCYAKPYFTANQMYSLYLGLNAGIQPAYDSNEYSFQQMEEIRQAQMAKINYHKLLNRNLKTSDMKRLRIDMELGVV